MNPVTFAGDVPLEGPSRRQERATLRRAAEAFEALLVQQLVKQIRQSQLDHGLFGESPGASVYDAMFDQYLGERLARDSPFGVARLLETRWAENLEGPDRATRARSEAGRILRDSALEAQVLRPRADD